MTVVYASFFIVFQTLSSMYVYFFLVPGVRVRVRARVTEPPTLFHIILIFSYVPDPVMTWHRYLREDVESLVDRSDAHGVCLLVLRPHVLHGKAGAALTEPPSTAEVVEG